LKQEKGINQFSLIQKSEEAPIVTIKELAKVANVSHYRQTGEVLSIIDKPSHNTQKEGGKNKVVQKSEQAPMERFRRYLLKRLLKHEKKIK